MRKTAKSKHCFAAVLVLVGISGVLVAWLYFSREPPDVEANASMPAAKANPTPRSSSPAPQKESDEPAVAVDAVQIANFLGDPYGGKWRGQEIVSYSATTNTDGTVVEKMRTADGKSHRVTNPPKRLFDNASDQLIAMVISGARNGVGMPPLPVSESIEEDFLRSLGTPIEEKDEDSDEIKLLKRDVMAVRRDIKELVSQGMTVKEALEAHQDEVNRVSEWHREALNMLTEIRNSEGSEAANEFLRKVNESLIASGTPAIPESTKGISKRMLNR